MTTILNQLLTDFGDLLNHLVRPDTLAILGTLGTITYKGFKNIRANLEKEQNALIDETRKRLDALEKNTLDDLREIKKEILRIQILQGIDSKRLSMSEVLSFYDRYKALGGNSFVTDRVHAYLEYLEKGGDHN